MHAFKSQSVVEYTGHRINCSLAPKMLAIESVSYNMDKHQEFEYIP
jgi:hypothetical protein